MTDKEEKKQAAKKWLDDLMFKRMLKANGWDRQAESGDQE